MADRAGVELHIVKVRPRNDHGPWVRLESGRAARCLYRPFLLLFLLATAVALGLALATRESAAVRLQLVNQTYVLGGRHASWLSIRLAPGSPACALSACWEERDGTEGLVVDLAKSGGQVRLQIENRLEAASLLHWHGITVPFSEDGVPGLTRLALEAGATMNADFRIRQRGSFWLHSHYHWQLAQGLASFLLVVDSSQPDEAHQRDVVFFLQDAMPLRPDCALEIAHGIDAGLDAGVCGSLSWRPPPFGDGRTVGTIGSHEGLLNSCVCPALGPALCSCTGMPHVGTACPAAACANQSARCPTRCPSLEGADLYDTDDEAFNFCRYTSEQQPDLGWLHTRFWGWWRAYGALLANQAYLSTESAVEAPAASDATSSPSRGDHPAASPPLFSARARQVVVWPGEKVRLRAINAASSVCFWVRVPHALAPLAIAVDGSPIQPANASSTIASMPAFPLCNGQRVDLTLSVPPEAMGRRFFLSAQWQGERNQTGMWLVVGGVPAGPPPPLAALVAEPAPIIDFAFERGLRAQQAPRKPTEGTADRTLELNLTGGWINRFSLNRRVWLTDVSPRSCAQPNPDPLIVREGERVCIRMQNQGAVGHPMHLHGHSFQVVELDGKAVEDAPMRDTLQMPPRCHSATICFVADNPGEWLLHCHMIEHSVDGMATSVLYEAGRAPTWQACTTQAAATVAAGPPFGPTLAVRSAGGNVWAGSGRRVFLLDSSLRERAHSDELGSKDVNAVGVSLSGRHALVSAEGMLHLMTVNGSKLTAQPVRGFRASLVTSRVSDAVALSPSVEMFVVAATDTDPSASAGVVLLVHLVGGGQDASVVASCQVGSAARDAKMAAKSDGLIMASTPSSLALLRWANGVSLSLERTIALPDGTDGFDLTAGVGGQNASGVSPGLAVVAAGPNGLLLIEVGPNGRGVLSQSVCSLVDSNSAHTPPSMATDDLTSAPELTRARLTSVAPTAVQQAIPGWTGGARAISSLALALVVADSGLLAFDISHPARPRRTWACGLAGGTGYNVAIDAAAQLAFVAAATGGLHAISFSGETPTAQAHFGVGTPQPCNTTWPV